MNPHNEYKKGDEEPVLTYKEEKMEELRRLVLSYPPSSLPFDTFLSQTIDSLEAKHQGEIKQLLEGIKERVLESLPDRKIENDPYSDRVDVAEREGFNKCLEEVKVSLKDKINEMS